MSDVSITSIPSEVHETTHVARNCTVTAHHMYSLACRQVEPPPNTTAQSEQLTPFDTEFNLVTQPLLTEEDVEYNIRVFARNEEGESNGSNVISFIKPSGQW